MKAIQNCSKCGNKIDLTDATKTYCKIVIYPCGKKKQHTKYLCEYCTPNI